MANTSLDEQLQATKDTERAKQLEDLKQRQRRMLQAQRLARAGEFAAGLAGQRELAEGLGEAAELAGAARKNPEREGALRDAASNVGGRVASKAAGQGIKVPQYAANKLANRGIKVPDRIPAAGLSGGQAAAIGGAVAGALKGEGAKGIAESAAGWYALYVAFGFLTIGSFTVLGFLGALIYLDFHYIVSLITKGKGFFVSMNLWQKIILAFANMIAALIPLAFVLLVYSATCGNSLVKFGINAANVVSFGYIQNFCSAFEGGRSGGAGGGTSYPLEIVITSAYRPESNGSAHQRGEAVDIALRPIPASNSDPRILQLFELVQSVGLVPPTGDTIDEWNNPQEKTSAGHIHMEFNLKRRGDLSSGSFCDNAGPAKVPPTDLVSLKGQGLIVVDPGLSDERARVRACMLDEVLRIFNEAYSTDT